MMLRQGHINDNIYHAYGAHHLAMHAQARSIKKCQIDG
jgi:hypothetical protein